MGPAETGAFLDAYRAAGRSVYSNELLLTGAEAAELDRLIRENFEPGNRDYLYHYFEDNCSTRVRDILDTVLGGILADTFAGAETGRSYRWHVRRLLGGMPGIKHGLSLLIGPPGRRFAERVGRDVHPHGAHAEPRGVREAGGGGGRGGTPRTEGGARGERASGRTR